MIVKVGSGSHVRGMTTAAAIWVTAALGIVCGLGAFAVVLIAVLLLLLLAFGGHVDRLIDRRWRGKPDRGAWKSPTDRDERG